MIVAIIIVAFVTGYALGAEFGWDKPPQGTHTEDRPGTRIPRPWKQPPPPPKCTCGIDPQECAYHVGHVSVTSGRPSGLPVQYIKTGSGGPLHVKMEVGPRVTVREIR